MEPRKRDLALLGTFALLLAFHLWLLYRMIAARNAFLGALLLVAIGLFAWRIHHYAIRYRGAVQGHAPRGPADELRQIRVIVPVLGGLLALHVWLISVMVTGPPTLESSVFLVLLVGAVVAFVTRLAWYGRRYSRIRKAL